MPTHKKLRLCNTLREILNNSIWRVTAQIYSRVIAKVCYYRVTLYFIHSAALKHMTGYNPSSKREFPCIKVVYGGVKVTRSGVVAGMMYSLIKTHHTK